MLTVHIESYFKRMYNISKPKVYEALRELESYNLVEFHKLHSNNYIKLKKLSLVFIENKKYTEVASVSITYRKLKESILVNELILKYNLKSNNVNDMKNYFKSNTTLINKSKVNYRILDKFKKNNDIKYEENKLMNIRKNQIKRLKGQKVKNKSEKEFSINNMQARAIYITKITDDTINIVLLDLNNNYDLIKLIINLKETYRYIRILTDKKVKFVLVLHSKERKKYFLDRKNNIRQKLIYLRIYKQFDLQFMNLDISHKLFSNVKFLI
jgi:hypothetical protein